MKAAFLVSVASIVPKMHVIIKATAAIAIFPNLPKKLYKLFFTCNLYVIFKTNLKSRSVCCFRGNF